MAPAQAGKAPRTDIIVFDLDPGPPADITQCCEVALLLRDILTSDGLDPVAKTSGNKGMQVSAAVSVRDPERTSAYAQAVARTLEQAHPEARRLSDGEEPARPQGVRRLEPANHPAKTTVSPYSAASARTPDGVDAAQLGRKSRLDPRCPSRPATCCLRVEDDGDLFAPTLDDTARSVLPKRGRYR